MFRATMKNLLSHKIRLALTALSVVLGVAFVAGTFVFTDTIDRSIDKLFDTIASDTTVTKQSEFSSDAAIGGVPDSLVDTVKDVPGVENAYGSVFVEGVYLTDANNKKVGANGPPSFGTSWPDPGQTQYGSITIVDGSPPRGANQVVLNKASADTAKLKVGDAVHVIPPRGSPFDATLVGLFSYGESDGLGSTTIVFDLPVAQELLLEPGELTTIEATAAPGVSSEELTQRIQAVLPSGFEAKTAEQTTDEIRSDLDSFLGGFRTFLLVFAGISLFVGIFIILNTFSMLIAQRVRELGLLRAVGASRKQITRSVLGEALVIGLIGSILGTAVGVGLAAGLRALLSAFNFDFGSQSLVLQPRTVLISLVVGTLVTLVAAYLPARRAAKISPMAALRDDLVVPAAGLTRRLIVGGLLFLLGVASLAGGLFGSGVLWLVGLGVGAVFIGIIVLAPLISRPVIRVLGKPFTKTHGAVGRLARGNAMRNPRRTAATATALMIGLSLIAALSVFATSVKASVDKLFENSMKADYMVTDSFGGAFTSQIGNDLAKVDGVQAVDRQKWVPAKINGADTSVTGMTPAGLGSAVPITVTAGSTSALSAGQLLIDENVAKDNSLAVGSSVNVAVPAGTRTFQVGGIYQEEPVLGGYLLDLGTLKEFSNDQAEGMLLLSTGGSTDPALRERLDQALTAYPVVTLRDRGEAKEANRAFVDVLLTILTAMLGLAVLIAIIGIVNTLALSVYERTREIGLLRAVGLGRRQLRRMIRLESVVISVFGALLGVGLGVGFGVALQQAMKDEFIEVLQIPWGRLGLFVLVAAVVGVLAALWPARRAAKLDVMRAITTE
ncbi:MAG: FtsX-like permease family protein [Sporichthyaceae bacterium]|nr:FtsX-like permease family protein [Sporichthyaceae bacterium]